MGRTRHPSLSSNSAKGMWTPFRRAHGLGTFPCRFPVPLTKQAHLFQVGLLLDTAKGCWNSLPGKHSGFPAGIAFPFPECTTPFCRNFSFSVNNVKLWQITQLKNNLNCTYKIFHETFLKTLPLSLPSHDSSS